MRRWILAALLLVVIPLGATPLPVEAPFPQAIVAWQPMDANPVFEGAGGDAWDRQIRERGWIRFEDGVWQLYHTGYNKDRSPLLLLGHARRPTVCTGPGTRRTRRDGLLGEDMCVVHQGNTYFMFAEGEKDIAHLLTSPDGRKWTEHGPLDIRLTNGEPISPGPGGTPAVWVEEGVWYLFYERGDQGVWLAKATDPLGVWTNVQDTPVLPMGPEPYDKHAVAMNQIIQRDGVYYGFYHANAHQPWKDWTTCVARSKDLIHWEKYPGNPIIDHNWSSGILVKDFEGKDHFYTMHPEVRRFEPAADQTQR